MILNFVSVPFVPKCVSWEIQIGVWWRSNNGFNTQFHLGSRGAFSHELAYMFGLRAANSKQNEDKLDVLQLGGCEATN